MPTGSGEPIRLGRVPIKTARTIKTHVENLAAAALGNHAPDAETSAWVGGLDSVLYDKLAAVGLVSPREATPEAEAVTLGAFLKQYIDGRQDVRPDTKVVWRHVQQNLLDFFGASKDAAIHHRIRRRRLQAISVCKTAWRWRPSPSGCKSAG